MPSPYKNYMSIRISDVDNKARSPQQHHRGSTGKQPAIPKLHIVPNDIKHEI